MDLAAHLTELELRLQTDATRQDAVATAALLSADFREFGASSRIWDRAAILAELVAETPCDIRSDNFVCQQLAPNLALLTYIAVTPTRRTLRSSLWRLEGDRWRMVFHQGTVIPPA